MQNTPTQEMKQITYLPTTEKIQVDNYPYGRLRATAFFGLEFKQGKGFRTTFQTINPKNGRLNAVKCSTYGEIIVMYKEEGTGHIKYKHISIYHKEDYNKVAKFVHENFNLFTPEQISYIYSLFIMHTKATAKAMVIYCNSNFEDIKPLIEPAIKICLQGIKTGENLFSQIYIDAEKLEATKEEGFSPFKTSEPVLLSTLVAKN
jgi:hypothetical protein